MKREEQESIHVRPTLGVWIALVLNAAVLAGVVVTTALLATGSDAAIALQAGGSVTTAAALVGLTVVQMTLR